MKEFALNLNTRILLFVIMLFVLIIGNQRIDAAQENSNASTIIVDQNWMFYFAGNDSTLSYAMNDPITSCQQVSLPHTFSQQKIDAAPVIGFGWYFREIEIPRSWQGKDIFLEFEGVCLRSKVFVNGVYAGGNTFAYTPFKIDITTATHSKTAIHVAVMVDNRLSDREIPDTKARGWWLYGGLIRDVHLHAHSPLRIDTANIRTVFCAQDTFDLHFVLKPAKIMWDSVCLSMLSIDKKHMYRRHTILGTDTVFRTGGVQPWTPESPHRYTFVMIPFFKGKPGDTLQIKKGFCQLTGANAKLYLNGKPYFLWGIGRHDALDKKGPLLLREERLADLQDIKSLGANFLRIAHFPQHRDIYELCDSLGILVMDEIPAWKTSAQFLGSKEGSEYGAAYMKNLIAAHGNYTCVCIWSLGNQFSSFKTTVADFVSRVSHEVKKADPSRLVTFCSFYYIWDKAFTYVDVISINEYFGWELASLDMLGGMLDNIHKDWPKKPIIVSELGAQASRGLRNANPKLAGVVKSMVTKDISEDHQALFIRSHMDTIWNKNAYVNGMIVWGYADYRSYLSKAKTFDMPVGLNGCGIVTEDRKPKLSYTVVKDRYLLFRKKWDEEHKEINFNK